MHEFLTELYPVKTLSGWAFDVTDLVEGDHLILFCDTQQDESMIDQDFQRLIYIKHDFYYFNGTYHAFYRPNHRGFEVRCDKKPKLIVSRFVTKGASND